MPRCPASMCYRLGRASAYALLFALSSCAPWMSIPAPAPGELPPDTRLQVWRGRRPVVLREVTIEADSIRGRVDAPLGAHTAVLVVIPRTEVDSFQMRPRDKGNWFGAGLAAGILGSILVPYVIRHASSGGT